MSLYSSIQNERAQAVSSYVVDYELPLASREHDVPRQPIEHVNRAFMRERFLMSDYVDSFL